MRAAIAELQAFVHAALVEPVPRDDTESEARFRRRRIVAVVTLIIGAVLLGWALRIEPASLPPPSTLMRLGGAKSNPV